MNNILKINKIDAFSKLIVERTGIIFGEKRLDELTRHIVNASNQMNINDIDQYYERLLFSKTNSDIWDKLINKLIIGETYFFREDSLFSALKLNIFPEIIEKHQKDKIIKIWSAGCSTGEEPYSLAIIIKQIISNINDWKIIILATDIDKKSLKTAQIGAYRDWSFRMTTPYIKNNFFIKKDNAFEIRHDIKRMVRFEYLNLAEDVYPSDITNTTGIDLILWRNVAIYLKQELILKICDKFYDCLQNGGFLNVGASEAGYMSFEKFKPVKIPGVIVYKKELDNKADLFNNSAKDYNKIPDKKNQISLKNDAYVSNKNSYSRNIENKTFDNSRIYKSENNYLLKFQNTLDNKDNKSLTHNKLTNDLKKYNHITENKFTNDFKDFNTITDNNNSNNNNNNNNNIDDDTVIFQNGIQFMKQKKYNDAVELFMKILNQKPDHIESNFEIARCYANMGNLEKAKKWCEKTIELDPLHSGVYYIIALIAQENGETQDVISYLKKSLYLDSSYILAHYALSNIYHKIGNQTESNRYKIQALKIASKKNPDELIIDSDNLTYGKLLLLINT